jgi:hypothetical protein
MAWRSVRSWRHRSVNRCRWSWSRWRPRGTVPSGGDAQPFDDQGDVGAELLASDPWTLGAQRQAVGANQVLDAHVTVLVLVVRMGLPQGSVGFLVALEGR